MTTGPALIGLIMLGAICVIYVAELCYLNKRK